MVARGCAFKRLLNGFSRLDGVIVKIHGAAFWRLRVLALRVGTSQRLARTRI
jgi:hypothetical protein